MVDPHSDAHMSFGKYRSLQRATTPEGLFTILAIDHQDALRRTLNPPSPEQVSDDEMVFFKQQVVGTLIDSVSGVLLDPLYGVFQAIASGHLTSKGLLVELENADYQMNPLPLDVEIHPDWNVNKIRALNADGVKLFFYYNPFERDHAERQEAVVRQVAQHCIQLEIPFYAEPILYDAPDKTTALVETAKRIEALGVDVLKLEFPVDVSAEQNESVWLEACQAITDAVNIPWVLLSAGVSFDMFARQLQVACQAGASGFIVGRALWGDAGKINNVETRLSWLQETGRKRLQWLNAIVNQYGTPWQTVYTTDLPSVTSSTFQQYPLIEDADHE